MNRITLLAMPLIIFSVAAPSPGQTFEISPQSGFVYFPPGEGPGISGCLANDFRCDFGVSGTIGIETSATSMTFVSANLQLVGNQAIQDNPPFESALVTGDAVSDLLVQQVGQLPLVSDEGGVQTYRMAFDFSELEVVIAGTDLRIEGGRDSTPVDGDGYTFDVATTLVPEPGGACLLGWGLLAILAGRRRPPRAA